jgi:hypothetical protein
LAGTLEPPNTIKVICKVTFSFTPYPVFREILLNLSMKCSNSAKCSRVLIVIVRVGVMKIIYVAAVEALRKKER